MTIKLTKSELRNQQNRLAQLRRYLPTLQLKKAMLQVEVNAVHAEIEELQGWWRKAEGEVRSFAPFLLERVDFDLLRFADVVQVKKRYENIAGVEIPIFEKVVFQEAEYFLFDTPVWSESALEKARELVIFREKILVAKEKRNALEKELREVSIRVNLFEKVLIPRAQENIKKIRIFLGDQQLAAVAQAKIVKIKSLSSQRVS